MGIPGNIKKADILKAILRIDKERINNTLPAIRLSRKYFLRHNSIDYPPKLVISYANVYPNKKELSPKATVFTTYMAQDYLEELGFKIVKLPSAKRIK